MGVTNNMNDVLFPLREPVDNSLKVTRLNGKQPSLGVIKYILCLTSDNECCGKGTVFKLRCTFTFRYCAWHAGSHLLRLLGKSFLAALIV